MALLVLKKNNLYDIGLDHLWAHILINETGVKKMDNYTKSILTVIAVALVSISFQLADTNALQDAKASNDCGDRFNPCYVEVKNRTLDVVVKNPW